MTDVRGRSPAERLYKRAGFEYVQTKKMYYEDTGWTDYCMIALVIGMDGIIENNLKELIRIILIR